MSCHGVQVIPYHQRINMLLFKIQETCAQLASQKPALALGYAQSMAHDVGALHRITHRFRETLNQDLVCLGAGRHRVLWLVPAGSAVLTVAALTWRVMSAGEKTNSFKRF